MTPMIDVVFLLLIFFLCTANFQTLEEILPSLLRAPGTTTQAPVTPELEDLEEIVLQIHQAEGVPSWELQGNAYDQWPPVLAILRELAELENRLPVILDVDGDVELGEMIDVYDACRQVGFVDIRFAAEEPSSSPTVR